MTSFVVVGGGVAGLVAARTLAAGGADVILLEASDHLGGTVAHHTVGGLILDAGAESFATRGGTVAALATEIGLGDEIVAPNPAAAWLQRPNGPVPLPATSLLGIPGIPAANDVIAVVGTGTALRAYLEALLPGPVGAKSKTLGELVRKRMGSGMLEKLVAPVAGGIHSAHPDTLDLDRVAPGLRKALINEGSLARAVQELRANAPAGSAVLGIRGGVHRLVLELEADLQALGVDVRLGQRVERVTIGSAVLANETIPGTIVVAAPNIAGASERLSVSLEPKRVTLATLVVDAPELDAAPRGSGVLVAEGAAGIVARALTHATAKWQWLADRAEGKHVLRLSYDPDRLARTDLRDVARKDAAALLGISLSAPQVLDFARVDWTRAPTQGAAVDGVTLVGEATSGTGLAAVIAQATAAATALLEERAAAAAVPPSDPDPGTRVDGDDPEGDVPPPSLAV